MRPKVKQINYLLVMKVFDSTVAKLAVECSLKDLAFVQCQFLEIK